MKISAVYKITNTVTGDFYIGSSKNVKSRWKDHKKPSVWKDNPNKQLYQDMRKYGVDKFELQILEEVEAETLKETEQNFIETLKPTYNNRNANGLNIEKLREYKREYYQQNHEKLREYKREYYQQNRERYREHKREYYQQNSEKRKEYQIEYYQQNSEKRKKYQNKYQNQLCCYNGEKLTLSALRCRFMRQGIPHPTAEAKKYLVL